MAARLANVAAESNVAIDSAPHISGGHAAQVWLEGEASAELQAIAMTARHRLERGIWTSPGAGALWKVLEIKRWLVCLGSTNP